MPPGAYELQLTVRPSVGSLLHDTFVVHVLPAPKPVLLAAKVALFDPQGQTRDLLKRAGVAAKDVDASADLSKFDLLIIGKGAMTPTGPMPDLHRVREGLKVIVFEQTPAALESRLGLHVIEYGLRGVFERIPDHPALEGLANENLAQWRGEATITPSRLQYTFDKYKTPTVSWCGLTVNHPWRCPQGPSEELQKV